MPHPTTTRRVKATGHPTTRTKTPAKKPSGGGGINIPKFAGEVSRNYAKGVKEVGRQLDKAIPKTRGFKPPSPKTNEKSRQYLKKTLGK